MEDRSFVVVDGVVVPEAALLCRERENKYGSVPGLEDDELADPVELERQVMLEQFGPVLCLPVQGKQGGFRPELDEQGVDWSAFATVDFARTMPAFDKRMYKADRLRDKLKDTLIMLDTVKERLPRAKYLVLKYLREGIIDDEHIANDDMLALAKLDRRRRRIQQEIAELKKASWQRQKEEGRRILRRLGS